jgi:hypothetical protein
MNNSRLSIMLITILVISGCTQATTEIIPTPTETPVTTPIPFSELDLEPLLVQSNDLPPEINGSQVRNQPPEIVPGLPQPDKQIFQAFGRTDGGIVFENSGIYVFIYNNLPNAENSYLFILDAMQESRVQGASPSFPEKVNIDDKVGEHSAWMKAPFMNFEPVTDLAWLNCHAVFFVRMRGNSDAAISYAQRLNQRLSPLVCR